MGIEFRPQVDVVLCLSQGAEISAYIFRIRFALDHSGNHEGGVDYLAQSELFSQVIGSVEKRSRGTFSVKQKLHPAKQHAVFEIHVDLARWHVLFERLDRRIVAARLESN